MIRTLLAPNPSAMTLDGTRTFIVGNRRIAVIDPGPSIDAHLDAIIAAAGSFDSVVILLTHDHPDHAAGAGALADRLNTGLRGIGMGTLADGDAIDTDAGPLVALATPGHTPDHASFHHPATATVFCGDLMMGGLDTALISPPEGDLRSYLASLERIRALHPARILPAHGPQFDHPDADISRYIEHRMHRCAQVAAALADGRQLSTHEVADRVYGGEVPVELRQVAVGAVVAYLGYLADEGRVVKTGSLWQLSSARD